MINATGKQRASQPGLKTVSPRLSVSYAFIDRWNANASVGRYPVGSYLLVPGGAAHFDGSDEDTIIIGTSTGVWKTNYVER